MQLSDFFEVTMNHAEKIVGGLPRVAPLLFGIDQSDIALAVVRSYRRRGIAKIATDAKVSSIIKRAVALGIVDAETDVVDVPEAVKFIADLLAGNGGEFSAYGVVADKKDVSAWLNNLMEVHNETLQNDVRTSVQGDGGVGA